MRKKKEIKLADFPEEVDEESGVKVYGEMSSTIHFSHLSHHSHHSHKESHYAY